MIINTVLKGDKLYETRRDETTRRDEKRREETRRDEKRREMIPSEWNELHTKTKTNASMVDLGNLSSCTATERASERAMDNCKYIKYNVMYGWD